MCVRASVRMCMQLCVCAMCVWREVMCVVCVLRIVCVVYIVYGMLYVRCAAYVIHVV